MLDLLLTIGAFLLAFTVLVTIHEFGHFWVARRLGVKVLRFSIGYGKPLISWFEKRSNGHVEVAQEEDETRRTQRSGDTHDGTEFAIAAWPLGGYVKMLDEREGEVASWERERAFNRQPVGKRFAIVSAGPVANFIFAIFAYWLMFIIGVPGIKPVLGEVSPGTPAAVAGLSEGHIVQKVNGEEVPTWSALLDALIPPMLRGEQVTVAAQRDGVLAEYRIDFKPLDTDVAPELLVKQIGLIPAQPKIAPVIDKVNEGSAAKRGGLHSGDTIIAVNGERVEDWSEVVAAIRSHPSKSLPISVIRSGSGRVELTITPDSKNENNKVVGFIGASVYVDEGMFDHLRGELRLGPVAAVGEAVYKTWDMSILTLQVMGRMLIGEMSVENISGPVSIARYAKGSASAGFSHFLSFLAVVSLSLGVINLLPIPVLDGGHLLLYLVEIVKGSPVSEETEMLAQRIGISLVLSLMLLAIYLDIMRLVR